MRHNEQFVRELPNDRPMRSKGTDLMEHRDHMTRRNFLARVTTLAGGVALAGAGTTLAGCGGNSGGPSGPQVPAPAAAPAALGEDAGAVQARNQGLNITGAPATTNSGVSIGSSPTAASVATTLGTIASGYSSSAPFGLPIQNTSGGYTLTSSGAISSTGTTLGSSQAALMSVFQQLLTSMTSLPASEGGITLTSTDTLGTAVYTLTNGNKITVPVIYNASGTIIFDPVLLLIPPPQTTNITVNGKTVPNPYVISAASVANNTGAAAQTQYNATFASLMAYGGGRAVASQDANGNLIVASSSTVPSQFGPGCSSNTAPVVTSATKSIAKAITTRANGNCLDIAITITVIISVTVGGVTYVLSTFSLSATMSICLTGISISS